MSTQINHRSLNGKEGGGVSGEATPQAKKKRGRMDGKSHLRRTEQTMLNSSAWSGLRSKVTKVQVTACLRNTGPPQGGKPSAVSTLTRKTSKLGNESLSSRRHNLWNPATEKRAERGEADAEGINSGEESSS